MLTKDQTARFVKILFRLREARWEGRRILLTSASVADLMQAMLPPLLEARDPEPVLAAWETAAGPFLDHLKTLALGRESFALRDGEPCLLISEGIAGLFLNSAWCEENCPRGVD